MLIKRICKKCMVEKDTRAFIGTRAVCRVCWIYLKEEQKRDNFCYVTYAQITAEKKGPSSEFARQ